VTLINTRDCFVYDLFVKESIVDLGKNRQNIIKREYYFPLNEIPENYRAVLGYEKGSDLSDLEKRRVGVTTYEGFYTNDEMKKMESCIEDTEHRSLMNTYLPMTA
jgi:hypothetical protein